MIKTYRVAAMAVAALGLSVAFVNGTAVEATEGQVSIGADYLDHSGAPVPLAELGMNQVNPAPATMERLVDTYGDTQTDNQEQDCLASAVYFEARGEPLNGQLAVADVVLNRVASPRYPDTICEVVEQPWQFSFVNATGRIPNADRSSGSWRKAVAVARLAQARVVREVREDVLWYHADYVSPSWGRRLARQEKIGLHIFYS